MGKEEEHCVPSVVVHYLVGIWLMCQALNRCPCPPFITPLAAQMPVVFSQGLTKQWTPCVDFTLLQTASNGTSGLQIKVMVRHVAA
ncbi:hypothetical protein TNCV_2279261 [Trichonephila clavipes]|uniref:Uncharacterized protein n=1 Tax=Trichonephila clavipes TaxID=2585209 RepID=A0A8X6UYN9_TRICX|nr:hypothetical protein TNCV_2279261 [Trichonephila clavipes]